VLRTVDAEGMQLQATQLTQSALLGLGLDVIVTLVRSRLAWNTDTADTVYILDEMLRISAEHYS
jgi:hypothetical protein